MDPRTAYVNYFEDLARRNVDIAHEPAVAGGKHFFLELSYEKLMGNTSPNNTGWNLVLMGYETALDDNKHGGRMERITCIFDVLRHVKQGHAADLQATYSAAREIGEEVLARLEEHRKNPCDAQVSAGIEVPYSILMGTKRTIEVGPRFDHYYGYRFAVDLMENKNVKRTSDPAKWRTL